MCLAVKWILYFLSSHSSEDKPILFPYVFGRRTFEENLISSSNFPQKLLLATIQYSVLAHL